MQYNSDGTLKDCCKNAFQDAAALQEKLTVQVDSSPELKSQLQSLQHIAADGTVSAVTAQQLAENAVAHEAIHTGPMQDMRGNSIAISEATQKNWSDDTLKLLKASEAQEDKMNHQFNSANKQETGISGESVTHVNIEVKFVAAEPQQNATTASKRPQRTIKPA